MAALKHSLEPGIVDVIDHHHTAYTFVRNRYKGRQRATICTHRKRCKDAYPAKKQSVTGGQNRKWQDER